MAANSGNSHGSHNSPNSRLPAALPGFEGINRFWDKRANISVANVHPGEIYVTQTHEAITTILGSCVAACIRDPNTLVGGMNHFMLPDSHPETTAAPENMSEAARYGAWAMEYLINAVLKQGALRQNLEIKIFGGARIISAMTQYNVAAKNVEFICNYLQREGLPIAGQDLGGEHPRKIIYFPQTGLVKVRELTRQKEQEVVAEETQYSRSLNNTSSGNDIEIFGNQK